MWHLLQAVGNVRQHHVPIGMAWINYIPFDDCGACVPYVQRACVSVWWFTAFCHNIELQENVDRSQHHMESIIGPLLTCETFTASVGELELAHRLNECPSFAMSPSVHWHYHFSKAVRSAMSNIYGPAWRRAPLATPLLNIAMWPATLDANAIKIYTVGQRRNRSHISSDSGWRSCRRWITMLVGQDSCECRHDLAIWPCARSQQTFQ